MTFCPETRDNHPDPNLSKSPGGHPDPNPNPSRPDFCRDVIPIEISRPWLLPSRRVHLQTELPRAALFLRC